MIDFCSNVQKVRNIPGEETGRGGEGDDHVFERQERCYAMFMPHPDCMSSEACFCDLVPGSWRKQASKQRSETRSYTAASTCPQTPPPLSTIHISAKIPNLISIKQCGKKKVKGSYI